MIEFVISVTLPGTAEHFTRGCRGTTTVGRADDCDVQLSHSLVSRRHAELVPVEGDRFVVRDLGSRNGTVVNGRMVRDESVETAGGAELQLGPYVLTIVPASGASDETVLFDVRSVGGRVTLDRGRCAVLVDGVIAIERLSPLELRLLDALASVAPNVVETKDLGDAIWEPGQWDSYMLHNLIRRVRRKLEGRSVHAEELITTVPGVGYRLV